MTKVYGTSDDLIEFEGDVRGEAGFISRTDEEYCFLIFSDGTILRVRYGKYDEAIWEVGLVNKGSLFDRIDLCTDSDDVIYSDIAYFKDGLKYAYIAKSCEKIR